MPVVMRMPDSTRRRALTVGGAVVDTFVVIESGSIERVTLQDPRRTGLLLEEGRKIDARSIRQHPGGGGVNTAISFARLGFATSIIAKIGHDRAAEVIATALIAEGVDVRGIARTSNLATGASAIVLTADRNPAILTARGANGLLEATDLTLPSFAVDVVYIAGLSNASARHFPSIVDLARRSGAFVAANPGARQLAAYSEGFWGAVGDLSLLSLNAIEAAQLVPHIVGQLGRADTPAMIESDDAPPLIRAGLRFGHLQLELAGLMRTLLVHGVGTVLVTDGAHGAYAASADTMVYCAALPVAVEGTTGAGDAFSSTFAAFASEGRGIEDCLWLASLNAAAVVGRVDATSGLLSAGDLTARAQSEASRRAIRHWQI